jgi:hypothetical protein
MSKALGLEVEERRAEEAVVIGVEAMHSSEGRFWQSDDINLLHR